MSISICIHCVFIFLYCESCSAGGAVRPSSAPTINSLHSNKLATTHLSQPDQTRILSNKNASSGIRSARLKSGLVRLTNKLIRWLLKIILDYDFFRNPHFLSLFFWPWLSPDLIFSWLDLSWAWFSLDLTIAMFKNGKVGFNLKVRPPPRWKKKCFIFSLDEVHSPQYFFFKLPQNKWTFTTHPLFSRKKGGDFIFSLGGRRAVFTEGQILPSFFWWFPL